MSSFESKFQGRVRRGESMSRHTSWHAGGPAEYFFEPQSREDLADFLRAIPADMPLTWLGLGSNMLVRDGGIKGAVICLHRALGSLERRGDTDIWCEAGVPCARIARQCVRWQLGPAEFFAGIPGTLGGALAMNAGAFGGETWQHVIEVEVINRRGEQKRRAAAEYRTGYRQVVAPVPDEAFLAARMQFQSQPDARSERIRDLLVERKARQPIGEWSCGSVFANPPGDHAARLIEACGLKGIRRGAARVSDRHANFIINEGEARAADLESLIEHVQAQVEAKFGIRLMPEVRIVGEIA